MHRKVHALNSGCSQ